MSAVDKITIGHIRKLREIINREHCSLCYNDAFSFLQFMLDTGYHTISEKKV